MTAEMTATSHEKLETGCRCRVSGVRDLPNLSNFLWHAVRARPSEEHPHKRNFTTANIRVYKSEKL